MLYKARLRKNDDKEKWRRRIMLHVDILDRPWRKQGWWRNFLWVHSFYNLIEKEEQDTLLRKWDLEPFSFGDQLDYIWWIPCKVENRMYCLYIVLMLSYVFIDHFVSCFESFLNSLSISSLSLSSTLQTQLPWNSFFQRRCSCIMCNPFILNILEILRKMCLWACIPFFHENHFRT